MKLLRDLLLGTLAVVAFYYAGRAYRPATIELSIGDNAETSGGAVACRSSDDTSRILDLARAKDTAAMVAFALGHKCKFLRDGQPGTVESVALLSSQICFRPVGEPDCLWAAEAFVHLPAETVLGKAEQLSVPQIRP